MKAILFAACIFLAFNSLHSIHLQVKDTKNLYFFNTTFSLEFTARNATGSEMNSASITSGSATLASTEVRDRSVFYTFVVDQTAPSFVTKLNVTVEAKKSAPDGGRRYIEEIEISALFDATSHLNNWTATPLTMLVQPPRFPHFQVKTDWQYSCPVQLSLNFCQLDNNTQPANCSKEISELVSLRMNFTNTLFNGGMNDTHDYSDKVEECPLAYQTRQDIGIGCIVAFWSIALAAVLWGVIKYFIKRNKKSQMD